MSLDFRTIQPDIHRKIIIAFRRDSFIASFGHDKDFGEDEAYLQWINEKVSRFPEGFVLVYEHGIPIGQLELQVREFEGEEIGYINLYYLSPDKRRKGYGGILHNYAINFFQKYGMKEYHLRVAPQNHQARSFYRRLGMEEMYPEVNGRVIRMRGEVT